MTMRIHRVPVPARPADVPIVVLDVVAPGRLPDYCVHGEVTCMAAGCENWCWLGDETVQAVVAGQVFPLCMDCARRYIPCGKRADGQIRDHRRSEGPHA